MSLNSDEAEAETDVMTVVHSLAPLLFKKETEMRGERRKGAGRERIQTPDRGRSTQRSDGLSAQEGRRSTGLLGVVAVGGGRLSEDGGRLHGKQEMSV